MFKPVCAHQRERVIGKSAHEMVIWMQAMQMYDVMGQH